MKNNTVFFLVLVVLLILALGALFYQYQAGDWATQLQEHTQEIERNDDDDSKTKFENFEGEELPTNDDELEAVPTVSEDNTLDVILDEIDQTDILEDDLLNF